MVNYLFVFFALWVLSAMFLVLFDLLIYVISLKGAESHGGCRFVRLNRMEVHVFEFLKILRFLNVHDEPCFTLIR
jgi:hypothetical protein